MTMLGRMTGSLVGLALMAGSIGTAQAQPGWGPRPGWDRYHRHHGNGFGVGDAIGVAALVGAVAIVATSMSKDRKAAQASAPASNDRPYADNDAPPPASGTDYGADVRDTPSYSNSASADDQMADACAVAARDEAEGQNGGYADVRTIAAPQPTRDGYNIDGEVESRASYRAAGGTTRRFTCAMRDGRVANVWISRDVVMR